MRDSQKGKLVPYVICTVFVIAMAALYIGLREFAHQPLVEKYRMLCDAFTIPGMLLVLLGCLVWASDIGGFYGIGYVFNYASRSILQFIVPNSLSEVENYFDYVQRKKAEGHITGYGFLFITGGISLIIAVIFLVLFYQIY